MRKLFSLAVICSLAFPAMALAQEDAEIPAEATSEPVASEPAAEAVAESPKTAADDIGEEYAGKEPSEGEHPFLDGLSWQLMASAFYRIGGYAGQGVQAGTYNNLLDTGVRTDAAGNPVPAAAQAPQGYPYTNYHGFGLNFAGGDVMYTGEKFAVRLDLRFGEGANLLTPIVPVKQAYVAWMPHEKVNIDFGFFDTIFGAEVADEWNNANYTRGALYFLRQPFNHMGVRMGAELSEIVGFTAMVTNGGVYGGTPIDDNEVPALGWQFGFSPDGHNSVRRRKIQDGTREVGLFFGGNHGANGSNGNKNWEHFFDLVLSVNLDWFTLIFNGDYHLDLAVTDPANNSTEFDYGHSLAFIFDAADQWSIGLRGEHLSGNTNFRNDLGSQYGALSTGTITVRYKPVEYLVISLEGRGEWTKRPVYFSRDAIVDATTGALAANRKNNYAAILGVTAHIGN